MRASAGPGPNASRTPRALTLRRYRTAPAEQLGLDGHRGADGVLSFPRGLMLQRLLHGVPEDLQEQAPFLAAIIAESRRG